MKVYRAAHLLPGLALFFFAFAAGAQTNRPMPIVQFGESYTLHSKILNEDRPYWVALPESYRAEGNRQKYPVLYVLDAEWNFYLVGAIAQFMNQSRQTPNLIVVGVPNMDDAHRMRDLTPTPYPNEPSSGGGAKFEKFLNEELAPAIDAGFRTVSYRILVGHSAGGALAADAFLRQSNGFQGFIAIDPALGWVNQDLNRRAKEFVPRANSHAALFIATAGRRSLDPANAMTSAQGLFASILRTNSSPDIRLGYEVVAEDHNTSRLLGLYDGLRFIFEGYKPMPLDPNLLKTPLLINEHFEQLSRRLGFKILPPELLVEDIAYDRWLGAHETNNAIECFKMNVRNYPWSANARRHLADLYLAAGKKDLASENYKRALKLDPNLDGVKDTLAKLKSQ
jgi:predicted alpha/beta superfamily hydrolase